ncbi:MAG: RNA methyltransferase, partial [Crocinitomicaceae bacterium]|nr:RNA methyltransferase [Crocinitomicaceae bacterium]
LIDPKGELPFSSFSVEELEFISNSCFITEPGLPAGQLIKSEFIPGHGLAMNTLSNHFRRVEVELDQALKYLKRESFHVSEIPEGWAIVSYNGYSLGWIKGVKTRINNYYPSQWRIRMR